MFKGYLPLKSGTKRPSEKVKPENFLNLDQVKNFDNYGGVLDENLIMIDIDDKQQAEILNKILTEKGFKFCSLKTTKGMHFYFKNDGVNANFIKKKLAIGIESDCKIGTKNTVVPLRISGEDRELKIVQDPDALPKFLNKINHVPDFFNMKEGQGRNENLFTYILKLQSAYFTADEIKETINIINKYIFKDPMDQKEIDVILRDESFEKPNFFGGKNGNVLLFDKFANYLKSNENIILINDMLHIYKDGVYIDNSKYIEKAMLKYIPALSKSKRIEVLNYLDLICENKKLADDFLICVNNGVLDTRSKKLEPYSEKFILKNKININYNPNAYDQKLDQVLNQFACNDKEIRALLEEMIGYSLIRTNIYSKSFILTGDGANGKSTYINLVRKLLGRDNVSSLGLNEVGQRFKTAEIFGKLVNLGDDISNKFIEDNSIFKKLVTGEAVSVEKKGQDPFEFCNYTKFIFASNEIPRINDTTSGLNRRIIIIPFNAVFTKDAPGYDPEIMEKITTSAAMEYLFNISLDALQRIINNKGFTNCTAAEKELEQYKRVNDPILEFLEDYGEIAGKAINEVYISYSSWCIEAGIVAFSRIDFSRKICKQFKFNIVRVRAGNNRIRVFSK